MSAVLQAEARKAKANTTVWWLLLGAVGLAGVSSYLTIALSDDEGATLLRDHNLQEALHGASAGAILVAVAGAIGMAGDWRTGQVSQAFLSSPRRSPVVAAKAVVYAVVGLIAGLASSAAALGAAAVAYQGEGLTLPLDRSAVWLTLLGAVGAAVLFGLVGVGLAGLLRNQVVSIVLILGWVFLVESIVFTASDAVGRWLPSTASLALARFPEDGYLSPPVGGLVLAAYAALALLAGVAAVRRSDVTV